MWKNYIIWAIGEKGPSYILRAEETVYLCCGNSNVFNNLVISNWEESESVSILVKSDSLPPHGL